MCVHQKLVSNLKFAYLESNLKVSFAVHILQKDGPVLISIEENDAKGSTACCRRGRSVSPADEDSGSPPSRFAEKERLQKKAELREKKQAAAELESLIREEAELLGQRVSPRSLCSSRLRR